MPTWSQCVSEARCRDRDGRGEAAGSVKFRPRRGHRLQTPVFTLLQLSLAQSQDIMHTSQ